MRLIYREGMRTSFEGRAANGRVHEVFSVSAEMICLADIGPQVW